jgi:hypothetical protein
MKLEFCRQIFEKYLNVKFHKIRPADKDSFLVDAQTNKTKIGARFRDSAKASKMINIGR